jgi:hypothetical protein
VSTFLRNRFQRIEQVEGVERIEKYEIIVYSMDSGISLKRKALQRSEGSSPFFGTSYPDYPLINQANGSN